MPAAVLPRRLAVACFRGGGCCGCRGLQSDHIDIRDDGSGHAGELGDLLTHEAHVRGGASNPNGVLIQLSLHDVGLRVCVSLSFKLCDPDISRTDLLVEIHLVTGNGAIRGVAALLTSGAAAEDAGDAASASHSAKSCANDTGGESCVSYCFRSVLHGKVLLKLKYRAIGAGRVPACPDSLRTESALLSHDIIKALRGSVETLLPKLLFFYNEVSNRHRIRS